MTSDTIFDTFVKWRSTSPYREQRRFLGQHRELLSLDAIQQIKKRQQELSIITPRSLPFLEALGASAAVADVIQSIQDGLDILQEVRKRGGTDAAILAVYVDKASGLLAFDLPPW